MLTVGDPFPEFELTACVSLESGQEFRKINHKSYEGVWKVYFAWPADFTFVCPTEIAEFGRMQPEFAEREARVLGFSVDSEYVHHAWRRSHPHLRELPFPMMADVRRELSAALGILGEDGLAMRAAFLVDPRNEIQFAMVTPGNVGRNPREVLRVLDAARTDELCPCNWSPGEETLDAAALLAGA
ncbi:peroxiredoxin [Streptomyces hoynatensis]|uniref:Alkyl hydroperoxide reductase C n=1 Tax=Streptomyces hoynatensis TaxID=1141874 RepID=A0A3A9ZF86_9ACTN|nr:peroxiredoxin [Streptomyces hoynatensis]RKN47000.1 peroxiredoxin [Streptomyces hoynatensis]